MYLIEGEIIQWVVILMGIQDIHLVGVFRVTELDVHHETVELGFGQGEGAFILDGVLRSHYHEWFRQAIGDAIDSNL